MTILLGLCEPNVPQSASATAAIISEMGGIAPRLLTTYMLWGDSAVAQDFVNAATVGAGVIVTFEAQTAGRVGIDMGAILTGGWDTYLASVAAVWAAAPCPVYVRFMHELNLKLAYPWDAGYYTPSQQISYYRYVVTFLRAHAPNVKHLWCVNSDPVTDDPTHPRPFTQLYPGDAYCDVVGFDWYNWVAIKSSGWHEMTFPIPDTYTPLAALAPSKPMIIGETNCNPVGGDKAQWMLTGFLQTIPEQMPNVVGVCLFDFDKSSQGECNWRFDFAPSYQAAWQEIAASPIYGDGPLAIYNLATSGGGAGIASSGGAAGISSSGGRPSIATRGGRNGISTSGGTPALATMGPVG